MRSFRGRLAQFPDCKWAGLLAERQAGLVGERLEQILQCVRGEFGVRVAAGKVKPVKSARGRSGGLIDERVAGLLT